MTPNLRQHETVRQFWLSTYISRTVTHLPEMKFYGCTPANQIQKEILRFYTSQSDTENGRWIFPRFNRDISKARLKRKLNDDSRMNDLSTTNINLQPMLLSFDWLFSFEACSTRVPPPPRFKPQPPSSTYLFQEVVFSPVGVQLQ